MRKIGLLLGILLLLTGCGADSWETVSDPAPPEEVSCWQEEAYTIALGLPSGAQEQSPGVYVCDQVTIQKQIFLTAGMEAAVRAVSGHEASEMTILETEKFGLPEYQFSWYEEEDASLCRADLILDDLVCYAVVCSRPETAGQQYEDDIRQVFASFGLFTDEGV